ncbi:unnamed protein product [Onchocerca flexuosa]|uniref:IF rod domain-containing protein n=1 Tax=Onchocerca flexuosa TaxID=387005 RepID=A0A183H403_9BILA|nr:unnamed protein product [Onchocerca flexuosa]
MYASESLRSLPGASGGKLISNEIDEYKIKLIIFFGFISDSCLKSLGRVLKMVTEMGSASIGGISPALSANAAKSFLEATDKEKKEMQGLNDRLGNYIDRVKKLEEQNRKLVADLEELRGRWGKDTSEIKVKLMKY